MRLEVEFGEVVVRLSAKSKKDMKRLVGLSAALIEAVAQDKPEKPPFGFEAGGSVIAENVGQEQEELWPDQVVISRQRTRRP